MAIFNMIGGGASVIDAELLMEGTVTCSSKSSSIDFSMPAIESLGLANDFESVGLLWIHRENDSEYTNTGLRDFVGIYTYAHSRFQFVGGGFESNDVYRSMEASVSSYGTYTSGKLALNVFANAGYSSGGSVVFIGEYTYKLFKLTL